LYINDIVDVLNECEGVKLNDEKLTCLLYADDIVLIGENENDLQDMLDKVKNWCSKWRMTVNINKSKIMHCRPKTQIKSNVIFKYGDKQLEYVEKYKYLGVIIDYCINYEVTASVLSNSASRALGNLFSKFKENKGMGYETFTKLYNSGVVPILDYSVAVWGFKNYKRAETVQNRAIRFYLGVHRFASNLAVNGDMGWLTCEIRQKIEMLRFWNRLVNVTEERLVKKVFNWDKQICKNNWCTEIKSVCEEIENTDEFMNNVSVNLRNAEEKLYRIMCNKWQNEIQVVPKLRFYNIFKSNFGKENFVSSIKNRKKRSLFAQLRYSILPLKIETGRYQDIPIEYRTCLFCNDDLVESESHFLLYCSFYYDLRYDLFVKVREVYFNFDILGEEEKIQMLMSDEIIKMSSKYIFEAFEKRQNTLYH
jgi:hypothetical protein